jgi:hypothetical protein
MPPRRSAEIPDWVPPAAPVEAAPPKMPFGRRAMFILWPSFVMAGVLEMLTFVVVDPSSFSIFGETPLEWSRAAVYTVTFFIYWAVIATSGALTALLENPPEPVGPVRPYRSNRKARKGP